MEKLNQWINDSESNRRLFDQVTDSEYVATNLEAYRSIDTVRAWKKRRPAPAPKKVNVVSFKKWLIAATISIPIIVWGYRVLVNNNKDEQTGQPGGYKARLKLANGTICILENWQTGIIARPGNYIVEKESDSSIRYEAARHEWDQLQPEHFVIIPALCDTLTTPRGGQYYITLSDGTNVLLNASSTLSIPSSFSPNRRLVELSGEAFFKVNRSPASHPSPFIVKAGNSTIEVLGTEFNVKAYDDEDGITATVVEGKVQVKAGKMQEQLTSNQQARILKNDKIIKVNADANEAVSWKTGLYQFKDEPLSLIMKQACRWYDMEFEFEQDVTEVFTAWIERDKPISEFLDRLSATKLVQFKVKGRKIIVHKPNNQ